VKSESSQEWVGAGVEVRVVLLEDEEMMAAGATVSMPSITEDVLAFLAETDAHEETPAEPLGEPLSESLAGPTFEFEDRLDTLLTGVAELLALGDVASALELLGQAERCAPQDERLEGARARCLQAQQRALETRLGDTRQVPQLKLRMAELMKLSLDAHLGFLLSRIDGRLSYEELFSVSGMPRVETMRLLVRLLEQDIILPRSASGTRAP
jgi:hypothetical protein